MEIIVYGDLISQPTRSLVTFLKLNQIDYKFKEVSLLSLEQRTEKYQKVSPLMKIPSVEIKDGSEQFNMFESLSIMKYLIRKQKLSPSWYPQNDMNKCTQIDICLDFHHSMLRPNCMYLVFNQTFAKNIGLRVPKDYTISVAIEQVNKTLHIFQKLFIIDGQKYVGGNDQMSIADLACYSEIIQLLIVKEIKFYQDSRFNRLQQWIIRMNQIVQIQQTQEMLNSFVKEMNEDGYNWLLQKAKL